MRLIALVVLGVGLLGTQPAMSQGLPEGIFASTEEGCGKLKNRTPAELGEGLDFFVFSKTGLIGYLQSCEFVHVTARNPASWVAMAFCEESNSVYPDVFAIAQQEKGDLKVTRLTEVAQQELYDDESQDEASSFADDMNPSELDHDESNAESGQAGEDSADVAESGNENFGTYVRCRDVKQWPIRP
jgi:hypothetical protein